MTRYQLLPPLSPEEYAALREDIRAAGVRVPIDVDENGEILDGHHRKQIADELGKECPERIVRDLPEFAKVDYALTVNLTRRHLDKEGRKALVTRSLKRDPRLSDREHARRCGVSHTYVSGVREALEAAEQLATSASRVGRDGRERHLPAPDHRADTPGEGLAGPAPDAEQASVASGTAAAGDRVDSSAAAPDHPGTSSGGPGEGAGSAPAPAAGGAASTTPPAAPSSPSGSATEGEAGSSAGTGEPAPEQERSEEGPTCESCAGPMAQDVWDAGFNRCGDCDPEGEFQECRSCGRPL
jgi:hypothetical protein